MFSVIPNFGEYSLLFVDLCDEPISYQVLIEGGNMKESDVELLNRLFSLDVESKESFTNQFNDEEYDRLLWLNEYLDVPKVLLLRLSYENIVELCNRGYNTPKWYIPPHYDICRIAAWNGHVEVLKWTRENGFPWDEDTCSWAAHNGRLDVLKWLREHGCPWDKWTFEYAAKNGHLEVLKWVKENGCP